MVFLTILMLLFSLKILKSLGIKKLLTMLLKRFLYLLDKSKEATNITIIGATLE